jgi:hypothetical protein
MDIHIHPYVRTVAHHPLGESTNYAQNASVFHTAVATVKGLIGVFISQSVKTCVVGTFYSI